MEFLKHIAPFIQIIRPKNLVIVGFTQWILYHFLLNESFLTHSLTAFQQYLLILDTIIIAAAGYVLNDIQDASLDLTNKPSKTYIPNLISLNCGSKFYYILISFGFLIALYIAYASNNLPLLFIYPLATLLLYLYSSKFKNSVLIGNVIVSLFVSMVSGIILVAEYPSVSQIDNEILRRTIIEIFLVYIGFSFIANLVREIIKDLEDMEGDQLGNLVTLPLKYGWKRSLQFTSIIITITVLSLIFWTYTTSVFLDFRVKCFILLFIAAPLLYVLQMAQNKMITKKEYTKMSSIIKWIMLAGLISIILISTTNKF